MISFDKNKAYMEVLGTFRKLMDDEYKDGGWLPPVREMCKRLNVSNVTYTKVTKRLAAESMAESFPGKGIYIIPKKYRPEKIGLAIGAGEESPFLHGNGIIPATIDILNEKGYECHLIQGNSVINVVRSALTHYVSGIIWLDPPRKDIPSLELINKSRFLPLICINSYPQHKNEPIGIPCISEDYLTVHKKIQDFFIKRKHRKIGYVVGQDNEIVYGDVSHIENCVHNPGKITASIKMQGLTGLVILGDRRLIESAFNEVLALPLKLQPEIVVWNVPNLAETCDKYPEIKVIGLAEDFPREYGRLAADMLLEHLETPENIVSIKAKTFQIKRTENFSANGNISVKRKTRKIKTKKIKYA